jgi:hypothetical protein
MTGGLHAFSAKTYHKVSQKVETIPSLKRTGLPCPTVDLLVVVFQPKMGD